MSARFSATVVPAERVIGSRKRVLRRRFGFYSEKLGRWIWAPKGFTYNGVSFPLIWGGDGEASSATHDLMYSRPDLYTRGEADAVLREALEAEGMNAVRRWGWFLGVRALGWRYFGKERDDGQGLQRVGGGPHGRGDPGAGAAGERLRGDGRAGDDTGADRRLREG